MISRSHLPWLAAGAQLLLLAFMAGEREWTLHHGQIIHLRTVPVDPRDVMRGDFVRLDYEISRVPRQLCRDGLTTTGTTNATFPLDMPVYAWLRLGDEKKVAELVALSDRPPPEGTFLRGRIVSSVDASIHVRYGLEAYFREQGKALELEQSQRREGEQAPLEMVVAVGRGGRGILKGHYFGPLSIDLQLEAAEGVAASNRPLRPGARTVALRLQLRNSTPNPLGLVDLPNGRSWALVPDERFGSNPWRWVGEDQPLPAASVAEIRTLAPGQLHTWRLDLRDTAWFVAKKGGTPVSVTTLTNEWAARFRFEYRSDGQALGTNPNQSFWRGRVRSRAFNAGGLVD